MKRLMALAFVTLGSPYLSAMQDVVDFGRLPGCAFWRT